MSLRYDILCRYRPFQSEPGLGEIGPITFPDSISSWLQIHAPSRTDTTQIVATGCDPAYVQAPRHFVLTPGPDGTWHLRPRANATSPTLLAPLALGEQPTLTIDIEVTDGRPEPRCVWQEGIARSAMSARPSMHVVELWLYYLRRSGRVSFDPGRQSATLQVIPSELSLPPISLLRSIEASGIEHAILWLRGIQDADDLLRWASTTSLVGILMRLGKVKEFRGLLATRPREYWLDLLTPLYLPLSPRSDGTHVFALAARDSGDGLLWLPGAEIQALCHVQVAATGRLSAQLLPIDVFGLEPMTPSERPVERLDRSCRTEFQSPLLGPARVL